MEKHRLEPYLINKGLPIAVHILNALAIDQFSQMQIDYDQSVPCASA